MFEKDVRKLSLKSRFIPDNDAGMKIVVRCNLHPCTAMCCHGGSAAGGFG